MKIQGLTVCVGYSDLLARSIDIWQAGLESLTVVTDLEDDNTCWMAQKHGATVFRTDAFYRHGAQFNKGWAIAECYEALNPQDWVLFFDADIVPELFWHQKLTGIPLVGQLYGSVRHDESGRKMRDDPAAGFFQLFNSQDPLAQVKPIVDTDWGHAGNYDSTFMLRWRNAGKLGQELPLHLIHLGRPGENWMGIGNSDKVREMQAERARRGGGWKSVEGERIKTRESGAESAASAEPSEVRSGVSS